MEVLPMLLDEATVYYIPDSILRLFAETSTNIIVKYVNDYCTNAERTGSDFSKSVAAKLREAYKIINRVNSYSKSSEAREIAYNINTLKLEDIRSDTEPAYLQKWHDQIEIILNSKDISDQEHFVNNSAIGELCKACESYTIEVRGRYKSGEIFSDEDSRTLNALERLQEVVLENKSYFREAPFSKSRGTLFTRLLNRKEDLMLIKEGIEVVQAKQATGKSARIWRRL